jgi:hypothetical protein
VSILGLFPKCIEKIVDFHKSTEGLGRIRKTPFTTMGIIKNFCSIRHVDNNDSMLSYILWFHANKFLKTTRLISYKFIQQFSKVEYIVEWVCYVIRTSFKGRGFDQEGEFKFPKYRIFFMCFQSSKVYHGTTRNIDYRVPLIAKAIVVTINITNLKANHLTMEVM